MAAEQGKQISLEEIRRSINGQEEFTFVIERKKVVEEKKVVEGKEVVERKEVPDGNSVIIKMKSLNSEERSVLENMVKSRNIDPTKDYAKYVEELRYLVLSRAIVNISLIVEKDGKTEEIKVNLEDKSVVEKFLRGLTYYTILALNTRYEDAAGQIFEDLKKKD